MILLLIPILLLLGGSAFWRTWRAEKDRWMLVTELRASLETLTHALRVGVGFLQGIERVAADAGPALAPEWRRLLQSVQVGKPLHVALEEFAGRVQLREAHWFVAAVAITQQTGGSLGGVLESLVQTLRERESLREKVGALTAQGKASGALLGCLPFAMIAALQLIAPEIIHPLFVTALGQTLLVGVTVSVATGGFFIYKIVNLKVA
jgi:tight adherence protein B